MKANLVFIGALFLIVLCAVFFWFRYQNKLYDDYSLLKYEQSVMARIADIKKIKGVSFITYSNNKRFRIESSINNQYKSEYIVDHLFLGDSIVKNSFSDTIRIFKQDETCVFIHKGMISK